MYVEHSGKMITECIIKDGQMIKNKEDRLKLVIYFKKTGGSKKNWAVIEGKIKVRPDSNKYWLITGKWTEQVKAFNEETEEELILWTANPMPENSDWMHRFTTFTINLNYLPDNLRPLIAPTDSRLSPT